MKVYIINTGKLRNDINLSFAHAVMATRKNEHPETVWHDGPTYAVLIEHPTAGWILYDLGSPADANARWPENVTNECYRVADDSMTMEAQLNKLGLKPSDIRHVIISHMHMDHIGNIDLFKDTADFYVSRAEAAYAFLKVHASNEASEHGFYFKPDVLTNVKRLHYLDERDEEEELFEGIRPVILPGHTPGVLGLILQLKDRNLLLTSDALNAKENYEGVLPGVVYDSIGFYHSLDRIKRLEKKYHAEIWFSHDMEQFDTFKKIPEYYE